MVGCAAGCTWLFPRPIARASTRTTRPRLRQAASTTARRVCARIITPTTMVPSCLIRTVTTSKPAVTCRNKHEQFSPRIARMNTDKALIESNLTEHVIGVFYSVYNELGCGFLESVYENAMALALRVAGFDAAQQVSLSVKFRGQAVGTFRADIVVEKRVVLEINAVERLALVHEAQLINYLKTSEIQVGLLLNFGPHAEFKRRIFK